MDVWKGGTQLSGHVQKMKPIQIRNIGQTTKRAPIRRSNKDVVMARIRQVRSKAAENRFWNAVGRRRRVADISCKARLNERALNELSSSASLASLRDVQEDRKVDRSESAVDGRRTA